jgi:hypothetical protein
VVVMAVGAKAVGQSGAGVDAVAAAAGVSAARQTHSQQRVLRPAAGCCWFLRSGFGVLQCSAVQACSCCQGASLVLDHT